MLPRHEHLIREIVYSARLIQTRAEGRSATDFATEAGLRAIVERKVEIIGDDLIRLRDEDRSLFLRVVGADDLIGLRNVIAYRGDDEDDDEDYPAGRFWHDIQRALPELMWTADDLLSQANHR